MARWARRHGVVAVPNQQGGALDRYGLTRAEADQNAWVISPDGRRLAGADAVNAVLRGCGGGWAALGYLFSLPLLIGLGRVAYSWFANRRSRFARFGVTPECDEPGSACT